MNKKPKTRLRVASFVLAFLGLILIIFSVYPIAEYEYISRKRFPHLVSPITAQERYEIMSSSLKDFKYVNNWSSDYQIPKDDQNISTYLLSVPKLGIKNALVSEGGEDLSKSLIQYPGTAYPGRIGNTVIFGHSVLPFFFNPKNYMTIFSTIPTLEIGDEIYVDISNVEYKYVIDEMYEVLPNDLNIFEQRLDDSYLSLVTCVPPGHPLNPRRLVVQAKLVQS